MSKGWQQLREREERERARARGSRTSSGRDVVGTGRRRREEAGGRLGNQGAGAAESPGPVVATRGVWRLGPSAQKSNKLHSAECGRAAMCVRSVRLRFRCQSLSRIPLDPGRPVATGGRKDTAALPRGCLVYT